MAVYMYMVPFHRLLHVYMYMKETVLKFTTERGYVHHQSTQKKNL